MRSSSPPKNGGSVGSGYLNLDDPNYRSDDYLNNVSPPQLSQAEAAGLSTLSGFEVEQSSSVSNSGRGNSNSRDGVKPGSPSRPSPARQKKESEDKKAAATVNVENMSAWDTEMPSATD